MNSVEVIIPVRNLSEHLRRCLDLLMPQLAAGDRVTVVDDASTDQTALTAREAGAAVLSMSTSHGPYFARQQAAMSSERDNLLFIDARSRPLDGLVDAHRSLLAEPGVALSCTAVRVVGGDSVAERASIKQNAFDFGSKIGSGRQLDFFPTANLGVRAGAFRRVGGFRQLRTGGDADLCWRIQLEQVGSMKADDRTLMDWVARDRIRAFWEQSYRYGRGTAYLQKLYAGRGVYNQVTAAGTPRALPIRRLPSRSTFTPIGLLAASGEVAFACGHLLAARSMRDSALDEPRAIELLP